VEKLKELAKAANPKGPFYIEGDEIRFDHDSYSTNEGIADCSVQICRVRRINEKLDHMKEMREFIAAANPQKILEMIADIESMEAEIEELRLFSRG